MDSLTQMTLGAAVGEAVLGRKIGKKALLLGALCGTLPDLDVFIPYADPIRSFTYHRGFSHSLFVLTLLTPVIVWLILKLHPRIKDHRNALLWLVWLSFITHILLDCLTVYGTQIFWPLWSYPVGFGSVFIIDPFYTVPLLTGVIAALVMSRSGQRGFRFNAITLGLSSLYLVWSLAAQYYVTQVVEASLASRSLAYDRLLVSAGPLNTLLWRIVAVQPDGDYIEGYYSLVDGERKLTFSFHESQQEYLAPLSGQWPVERLSWFTKGFYKVTLEGDEVVMTDLRMGAEPSYVFSFVVGHASLQAQAPAVRQLESGRDLGFLKKAWQRLWSAAES